MLTYIRSGRFSSTDAVHAPSISAKAAVASRHTASVSVRMRFIFVPPESGQLVLVAVLFHLADEVVVDSGRGETRQLARGQVLVAGVGQLLDELRGHADGA